jgi:peroxiredoxin
VFENNSVGTFNPTLNFISRATTILTNEQLKTLALSKNNIEIVTVVPDLTTPIWVNGWTRFPLKGN